MFTVGLMCIHWLPAFLFPSITQGRAGVALATHTRVLLEGVPGGGGGGESHFLMYALLELPFFTPTRYHFNS